MVLGYPGVGIALTVTATEVNIEGQSSTGKNHFAVFVDGQYSHNILLPKTRKTLNIFKSQHPQKVTLELRHNTETWLGVATVGRVFVDGKLENPPTPARRKLLVIGDSVTCGEVANRPNLEQPMQDEKFKWWFGARAYGMLLGEHLDAETQLVCYGGKGLVRSWDGKTEMNAPEFYKLTIPTGSDAEQWDQSQFQADVIVVSLGTNDFNLSLGDFPEFEHFVERYITFIQTLRHDHPKAQIFITEGAIVNDSNNQKPKTELRKRLQATVQRLSSSSVHYVPSQHYPGDSRDAHPTAAEHESMAHDMAQAIRPRLD